MSTPSQVESIFSEALAMNTEAERSLYLDYACGDDAGLRDRVERLLKAHPRAVDFLAQPALERHGLDPAEATLGFARSNPPTGADEAIQTLADPLDRDDDEVDDKALAVLEPSKQPGSLGRLGHYEVVEVLGKGSFGTVVKGLDDKLRRFAAIKLMSPLLAATSAPRKRFLREARSAAAVRHQNVVAIYAVEDQPTPYLVMEYIAGPTLQQKLDTTGPLEMLDVLRLGRQIAEGLAAAHATGLIHRDIKPSNILLEHGVEHVKITDFGLARAADDASISRSGLIAGTPMYMAPEQARGESIDHRADLFSLGSVLYTMCTGRPPFRAANTMAVLKRVTEDTPRPIREIIPEIPEWLCDLIARLHAKDPAGRFASAQEVADLLAEHAAGSERPPVVRPSSMVDTVQFREVPKTAPAVRRPILRKRGWMAAAAVLVMFFGSLGFTEATGVTNVHGTVIRLFSPEGTLVVEVDDPEVSVKVDGSDVVITGAGAREIRLKPGPYTVEASKDGKVVRRELVHVTRDGRPVVRITHEPTPGVKFAGMTDDASAWEASVANFLSDDQQVEAVAARLKERNPGFDGAVVLTIQGGVGRGLRFRTDQVRDISPVRALTRLGALDMGGWGLADLSPLRGMSLVSLTIMDTKVRDLSSLRGMSLQILQAQNTLLTDLTPLRGMPLRRLDIHGTQVSSLEPLRGMPLEYLNLSELPVSDLSALRGMSSLRTLVLDRTRVSDLTPLLGTKLNDLSIRYTWVPDLDPLKTFPLKKLRIDYRPDRAELLRSLKGLETINDKPVAEFWREVEGVAALDPAAWQASVAAMPANEQVKAVARRLKEWNPGFDGDVTPTVQDGVVTGLEFSADRVTDLSPVRALTRLSSFACSGKDGSIGRLIDLSPLVGLPLTHLRCGYTKVYDLSPLKGMPLTYLNCRTTKVTDLSPLRGMKLSRLEIQSTGVSDLTPLEGMPLTFLDLAFITRVTDLKPLQGMPLEYLNVTWFPMSDLSILKGMTSLQRLVLTEMKLLSDLTPLTGLPLKELCIDGTKVSDLSPIKDMSLDLIRLTPGDITQGLAILRDMKSLKTIGIGEYQGRWPAAEFWDRYDRGEFQ